MLRLRLKLYFPVADPPVPLKMKSVKEERIMVVAGITGIGIYYLLENIALTMTPASNVSVIVSVAPILQGSWPTFS